MRTQLSSGIQPGLPFGLGLVCWAYLVGYTGFPGLSDELHYVRHRTNHAAVCPSFDYALMSSLNTKTKTKTHTLLRACRLWKQSVNCSASHSTRATGQRLVALERESPRPKPGNTIDLGILDQPLCSEPWTQVQEDSLDLRHTIQPHGVGGRRSVAHQQLRP